MIKWLGITFLSLLFYFVSAQTTPLHYPVTPEIPIKDKFFDTVLTDKYRWMENPNDTNLRKWLTSQKEITRTERDNQKGFWKTYSDISKTSNTYYSNLIKKGKYYFALRIENRSSKAALYFTTSKTDEDMQMLIRPEDIGTRNENFSIEDLEVSEDNYYLAIAVSESGSDWRSVFVMDMRTKSLLNDRVDWVKFSSIHWKKDGFYYKRFAQQSKYSNHFDPSVGSSLCYHKLYSDTKKDALIFLPEPRLGSFEFIGTTQNKYLILEHMILKNGKRYRAVSYLYADSVKEQNPNPFIILSSTNTATFTPLDCINDSVIVYTNQKASNHCLYKYDIHQINGGHIIVEEFNENLTEAYVIQDKIFCIYYKDAKYKFALFDAHGNILKIQELPDGTCIKNVSFSNNNPEVLFYKSSFLYPAVVYALNVNTLNFYTVNDATVEHDVEQFESVSTTYYASDSVAIPLYLIYKKGLKLNGNAKTILYGYGGFGITAEPFFDPMFIDFIIDGGVIAVAGIRGGGEYGTEWHDAGKRLNKQRSFDDFIDAAQYLFREKYTNKNKLVLMGGSNGGLLVGAVITKRPDICKVAILSAGIYDMTRVQYYTVGPYNINEYGDITDSMDYKNMLSYSPIHQIKKGIEYPSSLIITGDNDDRVPPFQSYKFLAALQQNTNLSNNSYILYLVDKAGHQLSEQFDERTYQKAYIRSFINQHLSSDK